MHLSDGTELRARANPGTLACVAALAMALGACGGGGGSDTATPPTGETGGGTGGGSVAACGTTGAPTCGAAWNAADPAAVAVYDRVEAMSPTASMPVSGSANYNGYVLIEASLDGNSTWDNNSARDQAALGQLAMSANFGTGAVTGTMSNFGVEDGDTLGGTIALSNGTITGNGLTADAQGTLVSSGGNIVLDLDLDGQFVGTNAAGIYGDITGTANWNGVSGPVTGDSGFAVER